MAGNIHFDANKGVVRWEMRNKEEYTDCLASAGEWDEAVAVITQTA